ncbi:MAG: IS1380 family transposase [Planctomycetes bacterium]|nr:IS1380 family transposase [Planctomycetota bacterium]MBU4398653.1 IS1380 family transposase [Planctomycetota bacterium]MCG2685367.1 IS1380 family transposase [Planctomycetales bacterium]
MVSQTAFQLTLDFLTSKPIVVEPSADQVSSDAGLLPFRQLDERIGLTRQFAEALSDRRNLSYIDHSFLEMTRMRVYGILADYADQNDHDVLRSDPIFKLLCNRSIAADDLAGQPTLSRFENAIDVRSFFRLRDLLLDQFIASFDKPPRQLTLDIDPFDDPTHGRQQLTFFHGYYDQYQYLPRVITCAENDLVLTACLLHGTAHAALGAQDDLEYVLRRLREAWPDVHVHLRGDSGFGTPTMYDACEQLDIQYTIGIGMNARLKKHSDSLLEQAILQWEATGQPQRLFTAFWYQADSWSAQRWVVIKCEANAQGANRRAVVTNRAGATVLPGAAYDGYADRGESENRNKELKTGLPADRLSDHRYFANLFRLYLHTTAYNLLVHMRSAVADPPHEPTSEGVPVEALAGRQRRGWHNRRRERDPLGEGQPCTWRTRLIKVAARVRETTRRMVVELSASWLYLHHFQRVSRVILAISSAAPNTS